MRRYVIKRILHGIFVMWLVATTVFVGIRTLPGGPARTMLKKEVTPASLAAMRARLGLNRPLHVQYIDWMTDILVFNFGDSLTTGIPVVEMIARAAPKTISIGVLGTIIGLTIAIPAGIISATRKNQLSDYLATLSAFIGISMPAFFIGILLAVVFGVWIEWFPVARYTPLSEGIVPWFKSIFLPGVAVGLPYAAVVQRMMRSSLLEVLGSEYMKTARAKGLGQHIQLYKHAIQNAMLPVVTVAGIQLALIIGGSVTVELVFAIQGVGRLLVDSLLARDYTVVQAVIILIAGVMVGINLLVDLSYMLIDPRIRYEEGER